VGVSLELKGEDKLGSRVGSSFLLLLGSAGFCYLLSEYEVIRTDLRIAYLEEIIEARHGCYGW